MTHKGSLARNLLSNDITWVEGNWNQVDIQTWV